jgi:putative peptide zinc metalloprotease protein
MTASTDAGLRERAARLTVAFDGEAWVLGRPDLGVFVAVPEPGAVFVTTLQETGSVAEATARASEKAGEPVDGDDFIEGLTAAGLLDAATAAPDDDTSGRGRRIRWIEGISPQAAARLFGRTGWTVYAAALVFVIAVLVARPDLRPSWQDAWFLPSMGLSVLGWLVLGIAFGALHEAWHWLAGRAVGVPATFRVSYRGMYIVYETDLTQIVAVPRNRRHGVYLAGMAVEIVVVAVALALRMIIPPGLVSDLLAAVILFRVVAIVWQWAALPLRSDSYALLANALRCHNLYRTTWLTVKNRLFRLTEAEAAELAASGARDRDMARWFALLYVAGMAVMVWLFLTVMLPLMLSLAQWGLDRLASGQIGSAEFWEALLVTAYVALRIGLPPLLAFRERRLRRAGALL